jgi:hypothetical protein
MPDDKNPSESSFHRAENAAVVLGFHAMAAPQMTSGETGFPVS